MTDSRTPDGTGGTVADAAEAFERMLGEDDADSGADGALEGKKAPQSEAEDEPEASDEEDDGAEAEDGSDDVEDADEEAEEQPTYKVKVEDWEGEVTLDEALRGYQREQDYVRKTQALAEERKALEPEKAALQAERERTTNLLRQLEGALETPGPSQEDLDWMKANDPSAFAVAVAEQMQRQTQLNAAKAERERLEQANIQEQAKARADTLRAENERLLAARPAWKDPAEFQKASEAISAYATERGISLEEVGSIADHRLVLALHDAALYRQLQAAKPKPTPKTSTVKPAKPGVTSGQPKMVTEVTRARQRLAKTHNVRDAASVFEHFIPD